MTTKTDQPLRDALREACDLIDSGSAHCSDCDRGQTSPIEWRTLADQPPVEVSRGVALTEEERRGLADVSGAARAMLERAEHNGNRGSSMYDDIPAALAAIARILAADAAARGGA